MAESKAKMAHTIKQTGCTDILEAIKVAEKAGVKLTNLPKKTLETVFMAIASAQSQGAQASTKKEKPPET